MHVAVVGAGPAGCAAAIALAPHLPVTLISDGRTGVGEQLPPAARPLLERLGLLPLEQLPCLAIQSAWHAPPVCQDFMLHPLGTGWLLHRPAFERALRRRAVEAGARLLEPCRFLGLRTGRVLELSTGLLPCDFVLDATGRRGVVGRRLGVPRRVERSQTAVVGELFGGPDDPDQTLWVEALGEGWGYTCRTGPGRRVAAWLSPSRPRPEDWWASLQSTRWLRTRLQGYTPGGLRCLPADSSRLDRWAGPGWRAVGDAAESRDPLTGSGIFAALLSGLQAAEGLLRSPG